MSHHRYILLPFSVLLAMSILACAVSFDLGGETPTPQATLHCACSASRDADPGADAHGSCLA